MFERGWRLDNGAGAAVEWGGLDPVGDPFRRGLGRVMVGAYEVSETAVTTEDTANPRQDGQRMGQDFRQGVTHTFTLTVRGRTRAATLALLSGVQRVWRGDDVRLTAGATATLTTLVGGQERAMFGRPRRFQPNYDRLSACEATALCTFETVDDVFYGPQQATRIDLRGVNLNGFTFPFTFPLAMSPPTVRAGILNVGGTLRTPVTLELNGPISNPVVRKANGWMVKIEGSLAAGRVVTVDGRARTAVDQLGGSWGGSLSRQTRLAELTLDPGVSQQLTLSGTDATGGAYVVARWRDAFAGRG